MKKKGSTLVLVLTVMLFAVAMTLAALAVYVKMSGLVVVRETEENTETEVQVSEYDKLKQIDELIQGSYLKKYDRDAQMDDVYRTMLDSLGDQYSRYLSPEELKQLKQDLNSTFTGTGIVFVQDEEQGGFIITEVIAGGPAAGVGIEEGDKILEIDGKVYTGADEVINALKGNPGTKVDVLIARGDKEESFSIIRGDVQGVSVDSKTVGTGDIGYIKVRSFGEETMGLFETAISNFEKENSKGLILDLRDNPGGLFDEGVKLADRILPECLVSYTIDKSGERENYNSDSKKSGLKVVVLVNGNTASTAEMVAAALKKSGGATVIGTKTYGKGLIQETHVYDDGSAVNLTTKEFFDPTGSKIDGTGVTPDVIVNNTQTGTTDAQLEKAIESFK